MAQITPSPTVLSLNCLVLGDDLEKIFTVEIQETKNVSILKKVIKEENAHRFANVDASDLCLFHVSIHLDDNVDKSLKNAKLELLKPHLPLSEVLLRVEKNHLHIVVKVPSNGELISVVLHGTVSLIDVA